MLRSVILAASRNKRLEQVVARAPLSRDVVRRFVAGPELADAIVATSALTMADLDSSIDYLGEYTNDRESAAAATEAYVVLLEALANADLTPAAEVSVKLSAIGLGIDKGFALDNAAKISTAAVAAGTTVTIDMEDHTSTDDTLGIVRELRKEFPTTGAVLQAYLRRTEADCRDFAYAGSRVRLCKGAYDEPPTVAFRDRGEVNLSYVRCLNVLLSGDGYPMFATHDPRIIEIAESRAEHYQRAIDSFEFQLLYGVRPAEQRRLRDAGYTVRVYVPFGTDWYGYLMRRLAERPSNVAFFVRALLSRA